MSLGEIVLSIIVGVVSGILSGAIIYIVTKHREEKYRIYYYLLDYLYKTMNQLKVEIPSELLRCAAKVGDKESAWGKSIYEVIDLTRQYDLDDRIYRKDEEQLAKSVLAALNELNKWGKREHIVH